jgi:heavy metal efflux system protein
MFEKIVAAALQYRFAVLVVSILITIWGVFSFRGLTIEAFPDPTDTQVQIITLNPGQAAEEMERQVSVPIERVVNGTPGLVRVRSINLFGLSFVTLTFRDDIDIYFARAQITERLRLADLPEGIRPELGSLSTPIGEIYRYTVTSDKPDPLQLRTLQDWVIRPKLLQVDGVADVVSFGGLVKEIQVRPDPVAMAAKGITLRAIEEALKGGSSNASGGILTRGTESLVIRSEGLFTNLNDINTTAITTRGGTPIFIADVASVQVGWSQRQGIASRGAEADSVEGIILMRRGENPSLILERVREKVAELNSQTLTKGTKLSVFYDRTELVDKTLTTVGHNLTEGAILVVVVLFVFLLDIRAALIVAVLIPLSLLSAFIYLKSRGMSANLLSMGAVDFGVIVDGAVVLMEAIVGKLTLHREPDEPPLDIPAAIKKAVVEVARPTIFSLLIIIAAYLPIFLLERVEGRIFAPMAHTVVAALVGSLVFSVTLVPVLATFAYRKQPVHRESPILRWSTKIYVPLLAGALRRPWLVVGMATLSLFGAGYSLSNRGSEFLPALNEGALYITFTLPPNTSLDDARKLTPTLAAIVDNFPQVESRINQLGRPEDGTDPKLLNNLEFFIKLKPADEWPKETPTLDDVVMQMEKAVTRIPGIEVNFSQPIRDNVNESIAGQQGQIALKIYGNDLTVLQTTAENMVNLLQKVPGAADVGIVKSGEVQQIKIKPRREQLGRYGLTMDEVQNFLASALGGRAVVKFWAGDKSFDVVVRFPESVRQTTEQLSALRIPTSTGALLPLSSIADVRVGLGRAAITRENGGRYVGIRMNVRGRDMGTFVIDAQKVVNSNIKLQQGMSMEWGGEFQSKERAMHRLLVVVPVALAITWVLLFNAFQSTSLALLVLLNVPFALVGGAVGLWAFDMPVSIAAAVGFIALVGQASLNGVLVISAIEERRRAGAPLDLAIMEGARERLRAVLMTAALAALGLVPAAFSKAMGAEMQRPMAVVIVGGTVSAALLTLIVLPVMYRSTMKFLTHLGTLRSGRAPLHD